MPAPANDDYQNALTITPGSGSSGPITIDEATLQGLGVETGPGLHQTIWWRFVAGADATGVHLSTQGSLAGDAGSGDGFPVGSFGNLDTQIAVLDENDTTPTGAQHAFNDDSAGGGGAYYSEVTFDVVEGSTYWVAVGTFDEPYIGTVILSWSNVPSAPAEPPPISEIGDCPTYVHYTSHGSDSVKTWPNTGTVGVYTDGYLEWSEPSGEVGDLFVLQIISTYLGATLPAGYTSVLDQVWDNAPIVSPFNGAPGPAERAQVRSIVGYRILSADQAAAEPAGTINGIGYTVPASGPLTGEYAAARVYRFECFTMGGEFPKAAFDATPVVAGGFTSADYMLLDDPDEATSPTVHSQITLPSVSPTHVGNHVWLTLLQGHGQVTSDDFEPDAPHTIIDPGPLDFGSTSDGLVVGGHDGIASTAYLAGRDYFQSAPQFEETYTAGTVETVAFDSWLDGFIGTLHVDYEDWALVAGIAGVTFVVQAPESARPFNDDIANAYIVPECPLTLVECVFGQTAEGGESFPEGAGTSVWFKWTPTSDEVGVVIDTEHEVTVGAEVFPSVSEYDTTLAVYTGAPGSLTLVDSDDDSGDGDLSTLTIDVTGGTTYYIQVAGLGGDEGRLILTLQCFDQILYPYWGILMGVG